MKPTTCQPAKVPARDLPPFLTTPRGHHLTLYVAWLQEKNILLGVVVTERGYTCRGHTNNAVYDRAINLRRQKIDNVANVQRRDVIRLDLHDLRLTQCGIHAGANIRS